MMLKVFESITSRENSHLNLFYLMVPVLYINFIENMLVAKERLNKKNTTDCFITDDGFIIGIQYFLCLLK
jgi:WASH complex subunit 7